MTFSFGRYANCFDGYLECRQRKFHVYIDLDSSGSADSPRARFSFAHEVGHYFLDWHRCALELGAPPHGSRADLNFPGIVEREADMFAANLLLPESRIKKAAAKIDRRSRDTDARSPLWHLPLRDRDALCTAQSCTFDPDALV
jgi:hypothetical protein